MSRQHTQPDKNSDHQLYEIRLRGQLDASWAHWFDGFTLTITASGDTLLTGSVADQAALHGLFKKVRDVGLPLYSVNCLADQENE